VLLWWGSTSGDSSNPQRAFPLLPDASRESKQIRYAAQMLMAMSNFADSGPRVVHTTANQELAKNIDSVSRDFDAKWHELVESPAWKALQAAALYPPLARKRIVVELPDELGGTRELDRDQLATLRYWFRALWASNFVPYAYFLFRPPSDPLSYWSLHSDYLGSQAWR
jgi:hypothetical protein